MGVDRLVQEVGRARRDAVDQRLAIAVSRDHHHRDMAVVFALPKDLDEAAPIEAGHHIIDQNEVEELGLGALEGG